MTETIKPTFINAKRRGFLQGAAVAGGAAVSGAAISHEVLEVNEAPVVKTHKHKGYERTEHVNKYYSRARF